MKNNMLKVRFLFVVLMFVNQVFAKDINVETEIQSAKIFLKGAQVERTGKASLQKGINTVLLTNLPNGIDGNSIQVKSSGNTKILSVQYRLHIDKKEIPKDSIKLLQDQIQTLYFKYEDLSHLSQVYNSEQALITRSYQLHGPDGLDPSRLEKMAELYRSRLTEIKQKLLDIQREMSANATERSLIQQHINKISQQKVKSFGIVEVEIESINSAQTDLTLSYLILDAGWYPRYDLRANTVNEPMILEMKADVWQRSDEDWKDIKLSLSTANPTMSLDAPVIYPWVLREENPLIYSKGGYAPNDVNSYYAAPQAQPGVLVGRVYDAATNEPLIGATITLQNHPTIGCVADINGNFELSMPQGSAPVIEVKYVGYNPYVRNVSGLTQLQIPMSENAATLDAVTIQSTGASQINRVRGLTTYWQMNNKNVFKDEEESKKAATKFLSSFQSKYPTQKDLYSSQLYEIERKYTINSKGQAKRVEIKNIELNSEFTYYAAPKISEHVYLIATISDWEKHSLLTGNVNLFFEGTYIGKSLLDVKSFGDTIEVSFGPDKDVIVERKLASEYTKKQFIGGNKKETRVIEIAVKNKKQKDISVIIQDQIPISATSKIEISSKIENEKPDPITGIVTWKFDLSANQDKNWQFEYQVKMPKKVFLQLD
ncbi:MAG: mucoidy inhibitor MuiA family protein [Bacteroidetes bacterium]|nr:mucoidy inhibitor MuiA family protein [Bacteroidota bacterium]